MNLDTLRVFCDVVRCRSFSRGSAINHISQSAASQAIHQIERHLGVQLIDRTKRPFILTPEGEVFFEGCARSWTSTKRSSPRCAPFARRSPARCGWRPSTPSACTT